ncbi:MAG: FHA domain-containing protein, partial [Nitrospiraceae bacterium]|nr:FHA domain-containing protein [Nitrospiraceae bacterium]
MTQDRIVLVSGAEQHSEYVLTTALTIGRNLDSSIYLEDPQVSRRHAIVESTPNGTFVRDLGSGNGTFVGDRRVVECRLTDGDIITIGGVELRFETAEDSGAMDVRFEFDIKGHVESSDADNVFETFFQTPTLATTSEQRHNAQNRLAAIYKANQIISSERDLRNLFHRVLDQIFSLVPAHNGVILLKDEKTGRLTTQCVKSGSDDTAVISSSIVRRAFDGGEAVITYDAADDSRFGGHASIISQNIASAMCAPLTHHNQRLGVLYVDTRGTTNAFTKSDLELLVAFAGPAAIAIRNAQYVDEL